MLGWFKNLGLSWKVQLGPGFLVVAILGLGAAMLLATQTIDTSALRAFDASFKLVAGTLVSSPLRLNKGKNAVTIRYVSASRHQADEWL